MELKLTTPYPFPKGFGFGEDREGRQVFLHVSKGWGLEWQETRRSRPQPKQLPQGSVVGAIVEVGPKGLTASYWGPVEMVEKEEASRAAAAAAKVRREAEEVASKKRQLEYIERGVKRAPAQMAAWEAALPEAVAAVVAAAAEGKHSSPLRPRFITQGCDISRALPPHYAERMEELMLPYAAILAEADQVRKDFEKRAWEARFAKANATRAANVAAFRAVMATLGLDRAATPFVAEFENPDCNWASPSEEEMELSSVESKLLEYRGYDVGNHMAEYARKSGIATHTTESHWSSTPTESAGWGQYIEHRTPTAAWDAAVKETVKLDREVKFEVELETLIAKVLKR